jgi:hypothetical protein
MRLGVRQKLVLGALVTLVVVSFTFTLLQIRLSRTRIEEDLRTRGAVPFAREMAATIGDRQDLENKARLDRQIPKMMEVRPSLRQLDIIAFEPAGSRVVATSRAARTRSWRP